MVLIVSFTILLTFCARLNSSQKTCKIESQPFLVLPNFTEFLYFVANILSEIAVLTNILQLRNVI